LIENTLLNLKAATYADKIIAISEQTKTDIISFLKVDPKGASNISRM
jgi:hypothetical protein